jgi:hypothetical protein
MKLIHVVSLFVIGGLSVGELNAQSGWQWQNPVPQGIDLNDV